MNWWRADRVAKLSLTELLLAHPEIARRHPGEVAAARPSDSCEHCHKMLGPGRRVQQAVPSNAQAVVLLQLESEAMGPRCSWWDAGNLTFWMSARDRRGPLRTRRGRNRGALSRQRRRTGVLNLAGR
jgi:hypothetical protein